MVRQRSLRLGGRTGCAAAAGSGNSATGDRRPATGEFRKGAIDVLVATDVSTCGVDLDDVTHVINYQCPEDEKTYATGSRAAGGAARG